MIPDGFDWKLWLSAVAGSVVGLRAMPGATPLERWSNFACGLLIAGFFGAAAVDYMHVSSTSIACCIAFALGSAGLVIFDAVISGIKQTSVASIISSWLARGKVDVDKGA